MLVLLSFQASQENLNLQLPFFTWGRCERWKNNNFLFSFKLGNNEACITEDGRTDTSKIFLIKEVHLTLKERKWQTSVEECVRLVFCLFASLEHATADAYVIKILGINILQTTARSSQPAVSHFPSDWLLFWKIQTIQYIVCLLYCGLYCV